ncbi:MAG: helix-turn-helix domain-containing protein, partial [Dehalococcoidia bacterium]
MAREPAHVQELRCALGRALTACRQEVRWSQAKLADKLHYHRSAISHLEAGRHPAPRDFWKRADELLNADGILLAAYEALVTAKRDATAHTAENQRPQPSTDDAAGLTETQPSANSGMPGRRTALKLSLAAAVAPEMLNRVLSDAAAEAMEFTRLTGVSSVGHGMLEHLELVLSDLHQGYSQQPPGEQFIVARAYRARVDDLIRGRHTLKELRELYVYAGGLSELLAWLALDLGHSRTGRAYAVDSYAHAEQAGHRELGGWAADAMTGIATYTERADGAVQAATRGIAQVPNDHPLAIRLRAKAARASARQGDRATCESLFAEAQRLHDHMPTHTPSRFTNDTATLSSYAITAYPPEA